MKTNPSPFSAFKALVWRELQSRLGLQNGAAIWTFLSPVGQSLVLGGFLYFSRLDAAFGQSFVFFVVLGVINFSVFRSISDRVAGSVAANRPLFVYAHVNPELSWMSKALVELLIQLLAAVFLIIACLHILQIDPISSWLGLLGGFLASAFLGLTYGVLILASQTIHARLKDLLQLLLKPLYFASAIFYPLSLVPYPFRDWLYWNPLVHTVELQRHAALSTELLIFDWRLALLAPAAVLVVSWIVCTKHKAELIRGTS